MYVFRLSRHLTPLYVHLDCPTEDATPTPDLVEQDPDSFGGASRKTCSKASRYGRGTTRRQGALYALPTFDHNLRVVRAKDTEQALIRDGFHCVVSRIGDAWAVHHRFIPVEPQDSPWILTIGCHILPEALGARGGLG